MMPTTGGTARDRKTTDRALKCCVARGGHPYVGLAMYWAVRVLGVPWLPTPWRWEFGQPYFKSFWYTRR